MAVEFPVNATPLRTIVVPTDFSDAARRALDWAIALAAVHQARIVLVHAIQPHLFTGSPKVDCILSEVANFKLEETSRLIAGALLPMATECHVGKPWNVIRETAIAVKADLIIMGSRGSTGLDRLFLGSTADRVLRIATHPVLTVHPTDERPAFSHALLATDFSDSANAALAAAMQLVQGAKERVRITLMHVSTPPSLIGGMDVPVAPMPDWDAIDRGASRNLELLADSIRHDRLDVVTAVVRGYPVDVILEEAKSRRADLIAMGTRGATGLDRLLLGSTAECVLHHAKCPVLTCRAPDMATSDRAT